MDWKRLVATCFGLGWMPVAPGTWGSLPPALVFAVMAYCGAPAVVTTVAMVVLLTAGCAGCVLCAPASITATGKEDPGEVVADEFAGQAVAFLFAPLLASRGLVGWEAPVIAACGFPGVPR